MKKVLYRALVNGQQTYNLPKELPIPRNGDFIFINEYPLKSEIVCQVNYVSYHLDSKGKLITITVKCTKV